MKRIIPILILTLASMQVMAQSSVSSISPKGSCPNTNFTMSITGSGTNWVNTAYSYIQVDYPDGIGGVYIIGSPAIFSTTKIDVPVRVDAWADGKYTTRVVYNDGLGNIDTATLPYGFTVSNYKVADIAPDTGYQGDMFPVTITGACTNWINTAYSYINVDFGTSDITVTNEQIIASDKATADIDISGTAAVGMRDVYVHYFNGAATFNDTLKDGFEVLQLVGIDDPWAEGDKLSIYPNPARDFAYVAFALQNEADVVVNIIDQLGRVVQTTSNAMNSGRHLQMVDLSNLDEGIYFVEVQAGNASSVRKFIVSR